MKITVHGYELEVTAKEPLLYEDEDRTVEFLVWLTGEMYSLADYYQKSEEHVFKRYGEIVERDANEMFKQLDAIGTFNKDQ